MTYREAAYIRYILVHYSVRTDVSLYRIPIVADPLGSDLIMLQIPLLRVSRPW
mgnify:CR=1 FL=1